MSPSACLPIGLRVFLMADPAVTGTLCTGPVWPMMIDTAVGVQRLPQDCMTATRVLARSEWKIATRTLAPALLPYIHPSIGTAGLLLEQSLLLAKRFNYQ